MTETYLVRDLERALAERRASAASCMSTLGRDITTPGAFLSECWDVFGGAANLVTAPRRLLLMLRALDEGAQLGTSTLRPTVGTARLLADLVARYAGVPVFDDWAEAELPDGFTSGEASVHATLRIYRGLLDEGRLEEPGRAASKLQSKMAGVPMDVQAEKLFVAPAVAAWLRSLGVAEDSLDESVSPLQPLAPSVEPRFVFTAGETSLIAAVLEQIEEAARAQGGRIVVFCEDPGTVFESLSPVLLERGIGSALRERLPFKETDLGRAVLALRDVCEGNGDWVSSLTDFAYSPFSGLSLREAEAFNTAARADSLMTLEEAIERFFSGQEMALDEEEGTFSEEEGAVSRREVPERSDPRDRGSRSRFGFACSRTAPSSSVSDILLEALRTGRLDPQPLLGYFEQFASGTPSIPGLDVFRAMVEEAEACGELSWALDCLEGMSVPVSVETANTQEGTSSFVEFRGMDALDSLAEGSASTVIITDASRDAFAIPKAKPATESILEKLGLGDDRLPFEQKRRQFNTAMKAAADAFVVMEPLRRRDGNQTFPAFVYEEYVTSFSGSDYLSVDPDDLYKVPAQFKDHLILRDEADVVPGFGRTFTDPVCVEQLEAPVRGRLGDLAITDFMAMVSGSDGRAMPVLSASQMQDYAHCPYQWFLSKKVGIHGLDETLDALHLGTFAHKVFEDTFTALAGRGIESITEETLPEALAVADVTFDSLLALQPDQPPLDRCAVVTLEDDETMERLREGILNALRFMTELPAGFYPVGAETVISPTDAIEYAGAIVNGRVDRVDVKDGSRFVVFDYKGSVNGYDAGCETRDDLALPKSFQTLVYAQALRRMPPFASYACVGALYLSYRAKEAKQFMAGSVDLAAFDVRGLEINPKKSAVAIPFGEFLDAIEERVAPLVKRMQEGDIAPDPQFDPCRWCPATFCAERKVG